MTKGAKTGVIVTLVVAGVAGLAVAGYFVAKKLRRSGGDTRSGLFSSGSGASAGINSLASAVGDALRGGDGSGRTSSGGTTTDAGRSSQY
jgi:hypothetical protein